MKKECIIPDASVERQFFEEQVATDLNKVGVKAELRNAVLGYIGGSFAEGLTMEDPEDADERSGWFPFLTAALATKTLRSKLLNRFETKLAKIKKNGLTADEQTLVENDKYVRSNVDASLFFNSDLGDKKSAVGLTGVWNLLKATKNSGGDVYDTLMRNKYTQSSFTFLSSLGVKSGKKYLDFLLGFPTFIKQLNAAPSVKFNKQYGAGAYENFLDNGGAFYKEKIGLSDLSDVTANNRFNDAVHNITYGGGKIVDGKYVYSERDYANIAEHYRTNPNDLAYHETLLKDEQFAAFIQSKRDNLNTYTKEYVGLMSGRMNSILNNQIADVAVKNVLDALRNTHLPSKHYLKLLKGQDEEAYKTLNKLIRQENTPAAEFIKNSDSVKRFRGYENNYAPQYFSTTKEARNKRIWENANAGKYATKEQSDAAWDDYMFEETFKINGKGRKSRSVFVFDDSSKMVVRKEFSSKQEAVDFLYKNRDIIDEKVFDLDLSTFVKKVDDQEDTFRIEAPEGYDGIFDNVNRTAHRSAFKTLRFGAYVKDSNHLDHNRNVLLPTWLMESDQRVLDKKYAMDAGRRIYNMREGVFDAPDLRGKLLKPISDELTARVGDTAIVNETISRLESIYNGAMRVGVNNIDELERGIKTEKAISTWRNVQMAAYGFGMSYYAPFETLQQAMLISSGKALGNTLKLFSASGGADTLKNVEQFLINNHIVNKHLKTFVAEFNTLSDDVAAGGVLNGWEKATGTAADKVAGFSFTKSAMWLANQAMGTRLELNDLGLGKLIFGDFTTTNIASSAVNARAAMHESVRLMKLYKQFVDNPTMGGFVKDPDSKLSFTRGQIERKMQTFGISSKEELEHFANNIEAYEKHIIDIDGGNPESFLPLEEIAKNSDFKKVNDSIYKIASFATESMHGTNPLFRPEAASQQGLQSLLYQFATYPINLVVQNYSRRVSAPIKNFMTNYATNANGKPLKLTTTNIYSIYKSFKSGTDESYAMLKKEFGFTDEMIDNFPAESVEHLIKATSAIFGFAVASQLTLGAVSDMAAYPINDIYGEDQWKRTTRFSTFYVDEDGTPRTFADATEDFEIEDVWKMTSWAAGMFARNSSGVWGNAYNQSQFRNSNVIDVFPVGGQINKLYEGFKTVSAQKTAPNMAYHLGKEASKIVAENLPLVNSRPINAVVDALFKRKLKKGGYTFRDSESNFDLDLDFSIGNLETSFDVNF